MTRSTADLCLRLGAAGLATIGVLGSAACTSSSGGKTAPTGSSSGSSAASSSSSSSSSSSASGPSGAPSATQLTATLINPSDIPGDTFTLKSADPVNESGTTGVDGEFANAAGTRVLTDLVVWYPSSSAAGVALAAELPAGKKQITSGLTDTTVSAGTGGHMYQGTSATGPTTIIVFQRGNYVVTMEFSAKAPGDQIPAALAAGVATAQDHKVKAAS